VPDLIVSNVVAGSKEFTITLQNIGTAATTAGGINWKAYQISNPTTQFEEGIYILELGIGGSSLDIVTGNLNLNQGGNDGDYIVTVDHIPAENITESNEGNNHYRCN